MHQRHRLRWIAVGRDVHLLAQQRFLELPAVGRVWGIGISSDYSVGTPTDRTLGPQLHRLGRPFRLGVTAPGKRDGCRAFATGEEGYDGLSARSGRKGARRLGKSSRRRRVPARP